VKYVAWLLIAFCALLLQGNISVLGVVPNLTMLIAYYSGIRYGEAAGLLAGALTGFAEDSLSGGIIGPNMLSKGVVGYIAALFVSGGLFRWTPLLGMISVAALTVADAFMVVITMSLFDRIPAGFSDIIFIAVMQSLINASAGAFLRPEHVD